MSEQKEAAEVVGSSAELGRVPEREVFARWMADTHAPALRRMDADGAHAAGYAAGVAAERERCAQIVEHVQGWEGVREVAARIRGA